MKLTRLLVLVRLLAALAAGPMGARPARADWPTRPAGSPTYTVNSVEDLPGSGDLDDDICQTEGAGFTCTLRAAIMEANHTTNPPATIIVRAGVYVLTIPPSGVNLEAVGDLDLTADMFIEGAGAGSTIVDGSGQDRVLFAAAGNSIAISDLTIRNGSKIGGSGGGGIYNAGGLYLYRVAVTDNYAEYEGGGIASTDSLNLYDSLVSHNRNDDDGGGIYTAGTMEVQNSTISNNAARGHGGGIFKSGSGSLSLGYSTVAGNLADSESDNSGFGGGIYHAAGQVIVIGNLLAENLAGPVPNDCGGSAVELLNDNLVQTNFGCTFTVLGSRNQLGADPLLLPLQDNTGPTLTRALLAGSPALDSGFSSCSAFDGPVAFDQRAVGRPVGSACDIGAYEGSVPAPLFGRNLIRNGDAEAAAGSPTGNTAGVPQWTLVAPSADPTVLPYGIPGGYPLATDPGPDDRGRNYFAGGLAEDAYLMQTFDVTSLAAAIDTGGVAYDFEGYLGGYADQEDHATLYLTFRDDATGITGSDQLGPITAADRGNVTSLLHQATEGFVPPGTVIIEVELRFTAVATAYNDGYADNVSLVLRQQALFLPLLQH